MNESTPLTPTLPPNTHQLLPIYKADYAIPASPAAVFKQTLFECMMTSWTRAQTPTIAQNPSYSFSLQVLC